MFFSPHRPYKSDFLWPQGLAYWDFHPTSGLFTILLIQYGLVIQAPLCGLLLLEGTALIVFSSSAVGLLKSLTGPKMSISIKTDPGWSLLVAKLQCCTRLVCEVCNYIPLNNWNHCPLAVSSSNRTFNIISFYISYILQVFPGDI